MDHLRPVSVHCHFHSLAKATATDAVHRPNARFTDRVVELILCTVILSAIETTFWDYFLEFYAMALPLRLHNRGQKQNRGHDLL